MSIVDDLLSHVYGWTVAIERSLHDLDGPLNSRAGGTGRCKQQVAGMDDVGPGIEDPGSSLEGVCSPQTAAGSQNRAPPLPAWAVEYRAYDRERPPSRRGREP